MKKQTLGFIGGGRITSIFLQAFKNKSVTFESIKVFDTNQEVLNNLKTGYPEIAISDSAATAAKQDIVIIAVHPPVVMETLENIKGALDEGSVLLSLAPKITIEKISAALSSQKVVRMIPNATSFMNKGYNPVSFHEHFKAEEKAEKVMDLIPLKPIGDHEEEIVSIFDSKLLGLFEKIKP